ncbi:hypothetical protein JANAI62_29860 [Jannaschia pagri]|uniref:Sulfite reductase (NADPH) hemoprotein beta-component n=1 Tax=Jannaschia pagri TaxID=2829797 RepID=A0ABQ4NPR2_9RHOB|nr:MULTISPECIES: DUF2849 domain-containing protein [unclassified Jannaschia]GIT92528.1 hypothetical protein JANAI61_29860 [Jannaschia sp. AI_61]GIT96363.1 hypothetical protein JANAI62_29860 [Jannaschia sp. AI_62]
MSRRPFTPKVVTANLLVEGDVVYLSAADAWVPHLSQAEVFEDEAVAEARLLDAARQTEVVVGVYLADVTLGPDGPQPSHFREAFRASGPTNYPHGKAHEVA